MAPARADHSGHKGKVLIVDDQEGIRDLLRAVLEDRYCVSEADSGVALHDALGQDQQDVVLLDMNLPDANGLGLLPAIQQRWPGTQVIVLTGAPTESEAMSAAVEAVNRGAFSLLAKSAEFDMEKLLLGVNNAMERRLQASTGRAPGPQV